MLKWRCKPIVRMALLLFFLSLGINLSAQNIKATGTVSEANGTPMIGVTVVVKGTTKAVITDVTGKFTIDCPVNSTLVASYMGFISKEVKVTSTTPMQITLNEAVNNLDEVVVIGYGGVQKRDITGAISSVSEKRLEERQPINIFDALQGEVAGLQIQSTSGAPGEDGTMLIRGASTMGSGVSPMYIVDGVTVNDIASINPSDIQSIEVLKDAASAAIYGSRSAAGVIIVTTKRGKEGAPVKVSVKNNHSVRMLSNKLPQANAFTRFIKERAANYTSTSLWKTSNDSLHPLQMADNDMQDLVTRTAHVNQFDISISGAKPGMSYYTSVGILNEQGIIVNSYNNRITYRANVDYQASKKLKMSTRANASYQATNSINAGYVLAQAMSRPAQMAMYFPDGSYVYNNGGRFNPVADAYERINDVKTYKINLNQGAEYKIYKDLTWTGNVSADYTIKRVDNLVPGNLVSSGTSTGFNTADLGRKLMGETYLNWNHTFGKNHKVNAMAGASVEDWYDENLDLYGSDYVSESIISTNSQNVKDLAKTLTGYSDHSMASFFGRVNYDWQSRYMFSGTLRYDGSSRFVDKRWGLFPAASVAWRFSDEKFFSWADKVLTDGKLRASWGMTGNERVGNYDAIQTYGIGSYYNGISGVTQDSRLANIGLGWESTTQTNYGLDLTLLEGRASLTVDYYIKKTTDLLALELMPSELGVSDMRVNFGSIQNKGIEVTLSVYPIQTQNFKWQTTVNYSNNQNKVLTLAGGTAFLEDGTYWVEEGKPIGQWYGFNKIGIYSTAESNAWATTTDASGKTVFGDQLIPVYKRDPDNYNNIVYGSNGKPIFEGYYTTKDGQRYDGTVGQKTTANLISGAGDVIWEDRNNDGVISEEDRKVLGQGLPTWYMNWANYFTYKQFTLSFTFYGSFGNKIYNKLRRDQMTNSSSNATPYAYDVFTMWKYEGQITDNYSSKNATTTTNNARELSSMFLESGAYIKLQNVRIAYQLPSKVAKKIMLNSAQVYVYGNNLATWTTYTGYDPSSIGNSNILRPGKDNGKYPSNREFGLGININF